MVSREKIIRANEITWLVGEKANGIEQLKKMLGERSYADSKRALQEFLCGYFTSGDCAHKQGHSISPIGATSQGGKILKVRWGLPGRGKSGSLRLLIVAYCEKQEVILAEAWQRRDDPGKDDIEGALAELP